MSGNATFTGRMKKADISGDISGLSTAPVIQGLPDGSAGDTLTYGRGTQVTGNFYDTLDTNQGTIGFWIIPEWDGDNGKQIWFFGNNGSVLEIWKDSGNNLRITINNQNMVYGISHWNAGTAYHVICRWDADNIVAGSDYMEVYLDAAEVVQSTTIQTVATPNSTQFIGGSYINTMQVNAQIADLFVTRRPITTTEITALYNSGNGTPAGDVLPAEDICFYLPTNGTAEELTSGTGEALSFPMRLDNELLNWHMQDATAGAPDNWTGAGSPTLADAATADILFGTRSQKISVTTNWVGIYQDFSVTAGEDYTFSIWVKDGGTNMGIRVNVWDQTNAAAIVELQSTDSGVYENLTSCFEIPATCTTVRIYIRSLDNSTYDYYVAQVQILPNLVDNGGMEGTYVSGAVELVTNGSFATDTDWVKGTGWSIASGVASCDGTQTGVSNLYQSLGIPTTSGLYEVTFTISNYSAGNITPYVGGTGAGTARSANGTYTEQITQLGTQDAVYMNADVDFVGDIDDVSVKAVLNLPTGWINSSLETDGTDIADENADSHSGSKSLELNVTASNEGIYSDSGSYIQLTNNKYYAISFWGKLISGGGFRVFLRTGGSGSVHGTLFDTAGTSSWARYVFFTQAVETTSSGAVHIRSHGTGGASNFLIDDISVIELDDVTLTATPASLADSTDSSAGYMPSSVELVTNGGFEA